MKKLLTLASLVAIGCVTAAGASATATPTNTLVDVSSTGDQANLYSYAIGISGNGRYVLFSSDATNLVANDTNDRTDAFVYDRETAETSRVSVSSTGAQADQAADPFGGSKAAGISSSGRFVVFRSDAANLVPADTNGAEDIFVHDRQTGETTRVNVSSTGHQANRESGFPTISADGRYVAFGSAASNLVPGDTNHASDVFVRDRVTGQTRRISISSSGRQSNAESYSPALSAHGRFVAFASSASNLVPNDTNHLADVFVRDRRTGTTRRVSVSNSGKQACCSSTQTGSNAPSISADGRYVAFHSDASNLVPGDTNHAFDMFVRDRGLGKTRRVSVGNGGEQANQESIGAPVISADGRYVAFASLATNLVADDLNDTTDAFIRDRVAHKTILASLSSTGEQGNDSSWPAAMSADDRYLAFSSWAGNLVSDDVSPGPDVFVRDFGGLPAS